MTEREKAKKHFDEYAIRFHADGTITEPKKTYQSVYCRQCNSRVFAYVNTCADILWHGEDYCLDKPDLDALGEMQDAGLWCGCHTEIDYDAIGPGLASGRFRLD